MNNYFTVAALCLATAHVLAQPAGDPATAGQTVPATRYVAPLAQYRPAQEPAQPPAATWAAANAAVAGQGGMGHAGHQGHAGHAAQPPAAPHDHAHHGHHAAPHKEPQR